MRDHAIVRPRFWTQGTGKELRHDAQAQRMALYLMSAPASNMLGLYYLPLWTLQNELGYDSVQGAFDTLQRVQKTGFAVYDHPSEHVFVVNLAHEQVGAVLKAGDHRRTGIRKQLAQYEKCPLYLRFLERYAEPYGLVDLLEKTRQPAAVQAAAKDPQKPLSSQDQDQDQDQDQVLRARESEPTPAALQEWHGILGEACAARKRATPKVTRAQGWQLAGHVRDIARTHGVSFRTAANALIDASIGAPDGRFAFVALGLDPLASKARDVARIGFVPPADSDQYGKGTELTDLFGDDAPARPA